MDLINQALDLASHPKHTRWVIPPLLLADAFLSLLIIHKIPYTEIDWRAYMQQVALYLSGERDYLKLVGDTGPLVYPAAHVYIYRLLHALTSSGTDNRLAQYLFALVYLAALALAMLAYKRACAPPYVLVLLVASKRMHSVFLLRLFNDGVAVLFLLLAVCCYQRRQWTLGSVAFSVGFGVKMSLLLALPGVGAVLWRAVGRDRALQQGMLMGQVQVLLAYPFLAASPKSYVSRAFEFTRVFLFKWTVNWRFVGEDTFLSRTFSVGLLSAHAALLALFLNSRWLHAPLPEALRQLISPPPRAAQAQIAKSVTPDFILTTVLSSLLIGCLCARSLHYQFYAYIAWSTPFLLWRSGLHPVLIYAIWAAQEWAWNVFPSTDTSSMVVVGCLLITVASTWLGTSRTQQPDDTETKHQYAD